MLYFQVNWLAVIVSTIAYMAMGMLWYSPLLFGTMWAKLMKIKMKDANADMMLYAQAAGIAFLVSYGLAVFTMTMNIDSCMKAACLGLSLWAFFVMPVQYSAALWGKKPLNLFLIDTGFFIVFLPAVSCLMAVWR